MMLTTRSFTRSLNSSTASPTVLQLSAKLISARDNFDHLQRDLQRAWDLPLNENKCGQISVGSALSLSSFDTMRQRNLY